MTLISGTEVVICGQMETSVKSTLHVHYYCGFCIQKEIYVKIWCAGYIQRTDTGHLECTK